MNSQIRSGMRGKFFFLFLLFLLAGMAGMPTVAAAQEDETFEEMPAEEFDDSMMWSERSVVIVKSTADYDEALNAAQIASYDMDIRLDLRGLLPNGEIGLTWPDSVCEENGWEYPCFVARGRYDNGVYVSIEHSSAYEGFAEGYYIVVVASGAEDAGDILQATLQRARIPYPDAYLKKTKVYMGCMH